MKRKLIYLIMLLSFFVSIVKAEQCLVVSGTGEEIGDEVNCGGEYFYVIDHDGTNTKLLAKYNLLAGRNYIQIILRENITSNQQLYTKEPIIEKLNEGYLVSDWEPIDGTTYVKNV